MTRTVSHVWLCLCFVFQVQHFARTCTIFEFSGAGFAANAFAIAHMVPIFHNTNGTFFIDNKNNYYKCSEDGGWHDFFAWEDQLVPWTPEKEAEQPDAPCVRHDISSVNKVVFEDLKLTWDELDFIGIKKVNRQCSGMHEHREACRLPGTPHTPVHCRHGSTSRGSRRQWTSAWTSWRMSRRPALGFMSGDRLHARCLALHASL